MAEAAAAAAEALSKRNPNLKVSFKRVKKRKKKRNHIRVSEQVGGEKSRSRLQRQDKNTSEKVYRFRLEGF